MLLDAEGLFIKVSGLTSEADTLFAIALGANAVGFDFGPTPRQISPTLAHDIVRRLPTGVATVGAFRNEMPERIVRSPTRWASVPLRWRECCPRRRCATWPRGCTP